MMTRIVIVSTKILFAFTILIYFGGTLIICNEDVPVCDMRLKQIKGDVKNWERKCVNQILESMNEIEHTLKERYRPRKGARQYFNERRHETNSSGCVAEKDYIQERIRMHSKMCFYDGKLIDFLMLYLPKNCCFQN